MVCTKGQLTKPPYLTYLLKCLLFFWIHVKSCLPSHSKAVKYINTVKYVVFYHKLSLCPLFLDNLPPFFVQVIIPFLACNFFMTQVQ